MTWVDAAKARVDQTSSSHALTTGLKATPRDHAGGVAAYNARGTALQVTAIAGDSIEAAASPAPWDALRTVGDDNRCMDVAAAESGRCAPPRQNRPIEVEMLMKPRLVLTLNVRLWTAHLLVAWTANVVRLTAPIPA
jgi:hypothetical protein